MSRFRTIILVAALLLSSARVDAATFVVDTVVDAVDAAPGDGVCATAAVACSLRAAIQEANALTGAHTITVPAGAYALTIAGRNEYLGATGDLDIRAQITINGAGSATTIVDGRGIDRVFDVAVAGVTIGGVTVRGGHSTACGGGIYNDGELTLHDALVTENDANRGGGICNDAGPGRTSTLAATNVTVLRNTAREGGGIATQTTSLSSFPTGYGTSTLALDQSVVAENYAIENGAGLSIRASLGTAAVTSDGSTILSNDAAIDGGGVYITGNGVFFVFGSTARFDAVDTTISNNRASDGGGVNGSKFTLTRSTLNDNEARRYGGAIYGSGTIVDGTISGNSSNVDGGGLFTYGSHLLGVTITNNLADADGDGIGDGGGIWVPSVQLAPEITFPATDLVDTIIGGNHDAGGESPDCTGELHSLGHNLLANPAGCLVGGDLTGDVVGLAAGLGPLADNGGPTRTHALLPGSPALDAGAACSATDQRGIARPQGPGCDIGALEQVYVPTACGNGALDGVEACDDGNVRDGDCCNHLCQLESAGAACSDGNPCTDDACDGAGTCQHAANTAACTDVDLCTVGAEVCAAGACVSGPPPDCDDGDVCTADSCEPLLGCRNAALTGPACDDDNGCTASDACRNGVCRGTATSDPCDDGNPCTDADNCSSGHCTGTHNTAPCDDGDACTLDDHCYFFQCQGEPLSCPGVCEYCASDVGCTVAPRTDCRLPTQPAGASVQITDKPNDKSDALQWTWRARGGTTPSDLPDGDFYPDYELCVFDESAGTPSLVLAARPRNGLCGTKPCWASSPYAKYRDPSGSADGLTSLQLKAKPNNVRLTVKGKGTNLALPTLPLTKDPGVVLELRRRSGACWSSRFETPSRNTAERFKAKSD